MFVFRSEKSVVFFKMQCKWCWKLDTDWTLYDDKIAVDQLCHFFFFLMIATLCSKSEWSSESVAKWFHDFGSSMYIFLDSLPSQTRLYLNNGRWWKIAQKQVSLLVLQYERISLPLEYWNHWEALIVAEVSVSQWSLSIQDFRVSLHFVYIGYNVLLYESNLSE